MEHRVGRIVTSKKKSGMGFSWKEDTLGQDGLVEICCNKEKKGYLWMPFLGCVDKSTLE